MEKHTANLQNITHVNLFCDEEMPPEEDDVFDQKPTKPDISSLIDFFVTCIMKETKK